ncbi:amino acid adenylation domain-containing protein [Mycobacterium sp. 663a-19]|uniref:non-ribosomal peptide synthetase n=1 Tax=Mycobacterium sp. 663a-19 TaxID=2986148 RepID=UPI002D1F0BED|nr:amino acid adenylation domain-containing protein [Mycobacterium sp. 663a-19]MEB3980325.1 amino acid adenylation domain-containing protein [Mycobacterium sp. 663a-19]
MGVDSGVASARSVTETRSGSSGSASELLPLSVSQTGLWYVSQLAPDSPAYNELIVIRKTGPLAVEALRRALTEVVARHAALRTSFRTVDGMPYQFVREPADVDLPLTDLSDLGPDRAVARATEIAAADTMRRYDLADVALIRARLIRITDQDHRLYLGLHHLVCDGTTLNRVVFPELIALYRNYATGASSSLPDPEAQYADYTMWELDWVRGPEVANRIAHWRERLDGSAATQLPLDHPRPLRQSLSGGTIPLTIDSSTVSGLRRVAEPAGGTLFHALAAAYAWWLHLYGESADVVFGTTDDLRRCDGLPGVAGYCVTPVVLRCGVSGDESFTTLVGRMRGVVSEALGELVPFDTLVADLGLPRDPRSNPLFQATLELQSSLTPAAEDWSLHVMAPDVGDAVASAKFDISIQLDERPEGHVEGGFVFSTDLFHRATAEEMAIHWCRLLDVVAAAPGIPMAEHDLVTPDERQRQLGWNRTTPQGNPPQSIHDVISVQVERAPDAPAVRVGQTTLTYRQLDDRATVIASELIRAGAAPGTVVALLLDRTPDLVAAILGVLKSGAAFLPLDPRQPTSRNRFCINDTGASIVLTDRELPTGGETVVATVIDLRDVGPGEPRGDALSRTVSPVDLAYVIYTSGSTGRPKPALIEHRGVTNLMCTMFRQFGVTSSDTVLSVASIAFDMALGDIFCALACGARVVLATAMEAMDPAALIRLMADARATYMMATPATWTALIAAGWSGDRNLTAVPAGEALTDTLAAALLQRCRAVWNAYGPSETTVVTNVVRLAPGDTVTVGRALPNVRVYITDPRGRLQPIGVPGEIVIGGVSVGRGYLDRPEYAHRFADDPFHAGGRIYRTGDRGRFLPDGRIQHLGRYDEQLKIRGFRIEPGEIESALCEHPEVSGCAVVARETPSGEQQLVAYVIDSSGCPGDAQARDWLRRRLPEYMVPNAFVRLSALPTNASGKLDRAALPAPSAPGTHLVGARPPRTDTERRVAGLWAELLVMPVTDVEADFFDMGGHSLLAARLISEVERAFGVELSLAAFLDYGRTVAQLAELLDADGRVGSDEAATRAPLHFIFSGLSSAMSLRHFTAQWGAAQPVHALVPEQPGGLFDRSMTIEQHATQALSAIRSRQPDGPLALVGYSFGGLVAYEIARQAVDAGQQVEWLGVLDMPAPSMEKHLRAEMTLRWRLRRLRRRPARERWAKYREVALRVLRGGPLWPENDFDYRGAAEIIFRYQQAGHEVPMHLFVSEVTAEAAEADLLGWDEFHKGPLTAHRIAGDHTAALDPPEVQRVARMMLDSLRAARASRHSDPL